MIHGELKKRFSELVLRSKLPHGVVLTGERGVGKKTLGGFLAMALHCEGEKIPCGKCPSCLKHRAGSHPDFIRVTPSAGKKNISVEQIRAMTEELFIKPVLSEKKVVFIPEADLLESAAQNAMLKCFEEPPPYGIIILAVRNLGSLLETIRSRAAIYTVNPCSDRELKALLEERYGGRDISLAVSYGGGIIGKALDFMENEDYLRLREELYEKLSSFHESRFRALELSDFLAENEEHEGYLYELMLMFMRDAVLAKRNGGGGAEAVLAEAYGDRELNMALYFLAEARPSRAKYGSYSLWITNLIISLWEVLHGKGNRA